jgi:sugar lactone lactonase YvrE
MTRGCFVLLLVSVLMRAGFAQNPILVPALATTAGLSPGIVQVGSGAITLTLKGSGFSAGSTARLGSTNLATTYISSTTLTAIVTPSLLKVIGPQGVTVVDVPGGTSNSLDLTVTHRGDASGGGTVNIGDALVLARSAGGLAQPPVPAGVGDLNLNDSVNIGDALTAALFSGGSKLNFDTPTITSANVSGTSLTLAGTGFSSTADNNAVVFAKTGGGVTSALAANVVAGSGNKNLTVTIPSNAVSGPVFVKRRDLGLPGQPFVVAIPGTVLPLYISRASLAAGSITLTGSGFHAVAAGNIVTFSAAGGTVTVTPTAASATSLTATVPLGAVSGFVSVNVGSQTSNRKATLIPGTPTALVLAHVYYSDVPGEPILIEGTGFNVATPSDNEVLFNGIPGVVVAAGRTELIVLVPPGATTATLSLRTGGGTLTSNAWSFTAGNDLPPPPTITSIAPASGLVASSTNVTIAGRDFVSGRTTITALGAGVTASQIVVMSPTLIGATLNVDSTAAPGSVGLSVSTPGGTASGPAFTVTPRVNALIFVDAVTDTIARELTVNQGNSLQARARSYDGAGALRASPAVTWLSSNAVVASINASGLIQGNLAGFSTLTATAAGANVTATISVIDLRLQSLIGNPAFIAVDSSNGTLYVTDSANHVIQRVTPGGSGQTQTLAGTGTAGSQDGPLGSASFNNPQGIALDDSGNLWVTDSGNHTIRKINLSLGIVSTVAGLAGASGSSDGTGPQARFNSPLGIAIETQLGAAELDLFGGGSTASTSRLIVADTGNGLVRILKPTGEVQTTAIRFDKPTGVAVDRIGNIHVTEPDSGLNGSLNGGLKTILRNGSVVAAHQSNTAKNPRGVAVTASGKVIVTDRDLSIREIHYGRPQIDSVDLQPLSGVKVTIKGRNFAPESLVIASGAFVTNFTVRDTETIEATIPSLGGGRATTLTVRNRGGLHGIVAGDLTLRVLDTPHTLNGSLLVAANVKLALEPGAVLQVEPAMAIVVGGLFEARGTSLAPIRFTSRTPTPKPGDWGGLVFTDTTVDAQYDSNGNYVSGSILEHAIIEYAGADLGAGQAALRLADAAPFVNFTTIRNNRGDGIHAALDPTRHSSPRIANSTVSGNTRGIFASTPGNTILLDSNTVSDNTEDGVVFNQTAMEIPGTATVRSNLISGNGGDGLRAISNGTVAILSNTFANNRRGIAITNNRNGVLSITGNLIQNNQPLGGMFVNPDGAITISRNTVIFNTHEAAGGGLHMSGSSGSGVASITRNVFANNAAALDGGGMYLDWSEARPSGQATISNNVFAGNVAPGNAAALLGLLQNYDYFFTANTVTQNRSTTAGTAAISANIRATLTAAQNNWFNNTGTYTLQNSTASTTPALNAANNWWGTSSGPAIQSAIYDFSDDSTRGVITFAAALAGASVSAPISPPANFQVVAVNRTLSLQWNANPEADLAGYKVHYSTTLDRGYPYTTTIDVGNVTSYVLAGLSTGNYFVSITAYDSSRDNQTDLIDGNESWFAGEVAAEVLPPAPTLSRVDPNSAIQGTIANITFTGSNFIPGATTVAISGAPGDVSVGLVTVIDATTLSTPLSIGAQATTGARSVTVATRGGTSSGVTFTLFGIPTLTSISPTIGLAGTVVPVTITGTHFLQGATTLLTSGADITISAVSVINPTTLTAVLTIATGAASGFRNVRVMTAGGTSNTLRFVLGTAIEPISGLPGTAVPITLIGSGFMSGTTTVSIGGAGISIGLANVTNPTTLTATLTIAGNAPVGPRVVTVTTGISSRSVTFWVSAPGIKDSSIRVPPDYYSFLPPANGNSYIDPIFGSTIKRMSDATLAPDAASGTGFLPFISTEYSTMSPFNMDNSKILALHFSYFGLYHGIFDTGGNFLRNLPFQISASTEPRWSRTNPNQLYFLKGNQLKMLDVSTDVISVIHTFAAYTSIRGNGESDISFDGDHFVFIGNNRFVFVYQISTGVSGPAFDTGGRAFDSLYITPNNNVTITWYDRGTARYTGIELFDKNMNFVRQVTRAGGHMDVALDADGGEILVWTNSNDALATCPNSIVKIRLSTGQETCLLELDTSLALHISGTDNSGWFFVDTYAPSDPNPASGAWKPYTNEILQVKLDGTEVRRLAHHRSRPFDAYNYEPRASASRDGSRIVFTSNYSLQSILGYPSLYSDVYLIVLPDR